MADNKIQTARDSGYSDDEILGHLNTDAVIGPKIKEAQLNGYKPNEILDHLASNPSLFTPPGQKPDAITPPDLPANSGSTIMKLLGNALPIAGSIFGPEGTAAGSFAQQALPQEFGGLKNGEGTLQAGANVATDVTLNNVIPSIVMKGFSKIPAVARVMEANRVSENAKNLESKFMGNPELQTLPENVVAEGAAPSPTAPNFVDAHNAAIRASADQTKSLIFKGYSPATKEVDPVKILNHLAKNPDQYSKIDPIVKQDLVEFMSALKDQKPLSGKSNPILQYETKRVIFNLTTGLLGTGSLLSGHVGGTALAGSLILGNEIIEKLMENPAVAHLAIKAVQGNGGTAQKFIQKALLQSMAGAKAVYQSADGDRQDVEIDQNGELKPTRK